MIAFYQLGFTWTVHDILKIGEEGIASKSFGCDGVLWQLHLFRTPVHHLPVNSSTHGPHLTLRIHAHPSSSDLSFPGWRRHVNFSLMIWNDDGELVFDNRMTGCMVTEKRDWIGWDPVKVASLVSNVKKYSSSHNQFQRTHQDNTDMTADSQGQHPQDDSRHRHHHYHHRHPYNQQQPQRREGPSHYSSASSTSQQPANTIRLSVKVWSNDDMPYFPEPSSLSLTSSQRKQTRKPFKQNDEIFVFSPEFRWYLNNIKDSDVVFIVRYSDGKSQFDMRSDLWGILPIPRRDCSSEGHQRPEAFPNPPLPPTSPENPSSNETLIYAHKTILCARSEYFRMLFDSGLKESFPTAPYLSQSVSTFKTANATFSGAIHGTDNKSPASIDSGNYSDSRISNASSGYATRHSGNNLPNADDAARAGKSGYTDQTNEKSSGSVSAIGRRPQRTIHEGGNAGTGTGYSNLSNYAQSDQSFGSSSSHSSHDSNRSGRTRNSHLHDPSFQPRSEIIITDFPPSIVLMMLEYIYTGSISISPSLPSSVSSDIPSLDENSSSIPFPTHLIQSLYLISHQYMLTSLTKLLTTRLLSSLTLENCVNLFYFSERMGDESLKMGVTMFLRKNLKLVRDNPEFKELIENFPGVALEIMGGL
ncbi:hypothetical protein BKA69DRAFT_1128822 [Paraphysoderma sedebokerense]|nr:hypothetical protein BKA69DRAFT_1128822 [Paraphysoderma sedebokerense]